MHPEVTVTWLARFDARQTGGGREPGRDRARQLGYSGGRGVLPVAGPDGGDRRLLDELGTVEVGKALPEVDGTGLDRPAGYVREDGRPEGSEPR